MGFNPTKSGQHLGCEMGENPPFKETPKCIGKETIVFQPSIFGCDLFGLKRTVILVWCWGVDGFGVESVFLIFEACPTFDRSTASLTQLL